MQIEENNFDVSEDALPFNIKEWLRNIFFKIKTSFIGKTILLSCLFSPWYIWAIIFHPKLSLWWIVTAASLLLIAATALRPRNVLYWLAPCLLLFNTIYFWLPWPGIKISYIASSAVCFGIVLNYIISGKENNRESFTSFDFKIFFICLISSALIGILSYFDWREPGAWHELIQQLRLVPILSEKEKYVPLRYVWVWMLAISLYCILRRIVKELRDVQTLFWSLQFTSILIAAFGLYSYISRRFMVSHYVYEQRINATLSSPAVLADIFMAIFVIGLYLLKESKLLKARLFLIFALVTQLSIIFLSGCRTNFIILIIYLLVFGIIYIWKFVRKAKWYINLSAIILIAIILFGSLQIIVKVKRTKISKLPVIRRISAWNSEYKHGYSIKKVFLKGRFNHWLTAGNMIKDNPMWGVGCGLFEQKYKSYHGKKDLFWYARTHCIPLRICAEGGYVTLTAFLIFILLVIIRLSYGFTRRARKKEPEWSGLTRTISVIFLMIFISSFFTDIFYENSESIIFLSILSVCGACGYKHTGRLFRQHFVIFRQKAIIIEENLNDFFIGLGWEYLGFIKIKTLLKFLIIFILAIIIYIGISDSSLKRQKTFAAGKLEYGFLNKHKKQWFIIDKHAMSGFITESSVFSFRYKSLNVKMAQLGQYLDLYINDKFIGSVPLNSISSQIIYCDISNYSAAKVKIDFIVNQTYIPLKEKWFADPYKYGALITKPILIKGDLTDIRKDIHNDQRIKWITNSDFQRK